MTTPRDPERISIGFQTRAGICPACGGPATATRILLELSEADTKPWSQHRCDGCTKGVMRKQDEEVAAAARDFKAREALQALAVPPFYASATLETFVLSDDTEQRAKQLRVLQLARRYIGIWPDVPLISVFIGCPGSGKGHVAWSIARSVVVDHRATARVVVLSDVIRDLREAWGHHEDGGLSEAQRLAKYRAVDLLVIDEVSRHAFYGQPQQHLYDLISWRELQEKPTIITTNETGGDLAEFLGAALSSRALGWGSPWSFGDVDFRVTRGLRRARRLRLHSDDEEMVG